ncbi:efflux RND transporter periplasmic adaptor subunit [Maridesulfovibrio ferrireducens]|uniref:efflux RND transporter periplasmic adaptor subunit n=1 Tax=Maridesulfovibrio ferrireducens TaxID=246191 RepID=UPI001A31CC5D|nr:efflux RND transporter periplasmic adaptor subunit [Maridesulfovibrio ferrireducens]MBI9112372.1 efflux RND transporter periplasmic adaptor subunit [Maridesulfovibrio ferrireducens]
MKKMVILVLGIAFCFSIASQCYAYNSTVPSFKDYSETQELSTEASEQCFPHESFSVVFNPRKEVVLSSEVDSTVSYIGKEFGQSFRKGEVLIKLNPQMFLWRQDKAKALYEKASETFKVIENLYKDKSRSIIDLQEAKASLSIAEANMCIASQEVAFCTIKAPYSGRVEKLAVNEKEWVEAGTPLIKIVSDSVLLARTLVMGKDLAFFPLGGAVSIELSNGGVVKGNVSHVGAVMDSVSQTLQVNIEVANPKGQLKCGMTGKIVLPADKVAQK